MSETFINKVAESGLISLDLAQYIPSNEIVIFDIKPFLFMELILKEKPQLCVEIGVFGGSSLIPQALALKTYEGNYLLKKFHKIQDLHKMNSTHY